jgi:hypothetical protein
MYSPMLRLERPLIGWFQSAQISLARGDLIAVTDKTTRNGWWSGANLRTSVSGAFPTVYVRLETDVVRNRSPDRTSR